MGMRMKMVMRMGMKMRMRMGMTMVMEMGMEMELIKPLQRRRIIDKASPKEAYI
jgi:hypothetical protein